MLGDLYNIYPSLGNAGYHYLFYSYKEKIKEEIQCIFPLIS